MARWSTRVHILLIGALCSSALTAAGCSSPVTPPAIEEQRVPADFTPAWSPDGKWIAYSHYQQAFVDTMVTGLYVLEVAIGRRQLLVQGRTTAPAWFSDSQRLAFSPGGGGGIFVTQLEGGTPALVVAPAVVFSSVSPADTAIAFESPEGEPWGPSSIWIKDLQSGVERDISVHGTGEWRCPRWSPDGRWILHYRYGAPGTKHGASELFKMDPTGSISIRLTHDDEGDLNPCWSPSGSSIAWERGGPNQPTIWLADSAGSNHRISQAVALPMSAWMVA